MSSSTDLSSADKVAAIILGAGSGTRAELGYNKMFFPLAGKTVIEVAVDKFRGLVDEIVIVASSADADRVKELIPDTAVVVGGASRTESSRAAIEYLKDKAVTVALIHDGARPFVSKSLIERVIDGVKQNGSAIPVVKFTDSMKAVDGGRITATLSPENAIAAQTPQGFAYDMLALAYDKAADSFADDCGVVERLGINPYTVDGELSNIKLTVQSDFLRPELASVGCGLDVHRLVNGRPLMLGGIRIPYELGLLGHSDADVVLHAIIDALLSAASMPDIGQMFPDTDPQYKDISSAVLLERTLDAVRSKGYCLYSVAVSIAAEQPKLAPHRAAIVSELSALLGLTEDKIGFAATTTENLGVTANNQSIAAYAVAIMYKIFGQKQ